MWFLYHIEHSINSLKICKKFSVLYYEALCKRKKCRFDRTLFDDRCIYIWWFFKWFSFDYCWEKTKFENIRILLNGKSFAASHFCKLLNRNLSTWNRSRVNQFLKCVLGAEMCRKTDCIKAISCVDTVNCGVTMTHWKGYGCRSH